MDKVEAMIRAGKISPAVAEMRLLLKREGPAAISQLNHLISNIPVSNSVRFLKQKLLYSQEIQHKLHSTLPKSWMTVLKKKILKY